MFDIHLHILQHIRLLTVCMFLQTEVAEEAWKSACELIAKSVLGFMLSEGTKKVSMGALQQISLDTIQCECT
jgi:hypothetical protein